MPQRPPTATDQPPLLRASSTLTVSEVERFRAEGYLHVTALLDQHAVLDPILDEYGGVLDALAARLHDDGDLPSTYADLPFGQRLTKVYQETGRSFAGHFDFSLPQRGVQADSPLWVGPAVFRTLTDRRLLDAVESLIGPEIYSNPVQHVRLKPPERQLPVGQHGALVRATPWHQDNGVVLPEADATDMLTVWIPLTEASVEHGCLRVIPRSHREALRIHCPAEGVGLQIPEELLALPEALPLPTQPGDVLFLHKHTCHGSLPNVSDEVRCSFDLRYNPIGQPTGRGAFPGFVARSRANPAQELRDADAWARSWHDTRERLAAAPASGPFNRWDGTQPACA